MIEPNEFQFYKRTVKPTLEQERAYANAPASNNSFILRVSYLQGLIKSENWNNSDNRVYRIKTTVVPTYQPVQRKSLNQRALLFEKDLTEVFSFTKNFEVIRVKGEPYAPIITNDEGGCSLTEAVLKLSDLNKQRLSLKNTNRRQICEIGEEISAWGQNLQDIVKELSQESLSYPMYIHEF